MPQEMNLFNEEKPYISGQIKAIFFQNPSNYYKVMLIKIQETNLTLKEEEIVVTGNFGEVQQEEGYHFEGKLVEHPRYGLQFQVETYRQEKPSTKTGVIQYLSSDKFPGIGKITAEKIVDSLGINAIDKILDDPSRLEEISGLKKEKRLMLVRVLKENLGMEQVIIGLNEWGFGTQLSFQIYQTYQDQEDILAFIKENPYRLVVDIDGIGFIKADHLAANLGITPDSPKRIQACILHVILQDAQTSGNTYMEAKDLLEEVVQTLEKSRSFEIDLDLVAENIIHLTNTGAIQQEGTKIYENSVYFSEIGIANAIDRILNTKDSIDYPLEEMEKAFTLIEKSLGIKYGASQKAAIFNALLNPLFILTGGPGTGKTTIVRGLVEMYGELNGLSLDPNDYSQEQPFPILLGAPTGRAAKRLNETTQLPAATIHRLLGLTGREKYPQEHYRELEGGLLIIDEMSMVDTWLANTLLKAVPENMQVIFVGDKDQLPSVGPGQVLHDLLQIKKIPKAELTEIFRQGDGSSIIPLAHAIKEGKLPEDFQVNQKDRSYFPSDAYHIEHLISQVAKRAKEKNFNVADIQVLAPMYKGPAGIDASNKMLQNIFNGNPDGKKKEVKHLETVYRIGDKVLQLVNSPELNVFNGDMGIITGITLAKDTEDKVDELTIAFDGGEVTYKRSEWQKITLSYCCSIHKSQGSEFEMVILPMVSQYSRMLQRNLLYTAITRSRQFLILLGEKSAFEACVKNLSASRKTSLVTRITGEISDMQKEELKQYEINEVATEMPTALEKEPVENVVIKQEIPTDEIKEPPVKNIPLFDVNNIGQNKMEEASDTFILNMDNIFLIDPMIGMDGVTPDDFMEKEA